MNEDLLLDKIQKLIKDEIRPVKEIVEVVKQKVDGQDLYQRSTTSTVRSLKEQMSVMNEKLDSVFDQTAKLTEGMTEVKEVLDEHSNKINALVLEVHEIHQELGSSKDKTTLKLDKLKEHVGLPTSIDS